MHLWNVLIVSLEVPRKWSCEADVFHWRFISALVDCLVVSDCGLQTNDPRCGVMSEASLGRKCLIPSF